jgi:hypothetical protein
MPRVKKSIISTDDLEAVSKASTPPELQGEVEIEDIQIVPIERMAAKVAAEKFMNEKIVIHIEPGDQANDPVFVELGHNGTTQMVKRGTDQVVKRKFLYSALMAKQVRLNVAFGKDASGNEFNRDTRSVSTAYRARLVEDPNNREGGSRWVQRVMAESAG